MNDRTPLKSLAYNQSLLLVTILYVSYLLVIFVFYLNASVGVPACSGDCITYTPLMGKSGVGYVEAFFHSWRPWAVPVFFSLFGPHTQESALHIVLVQSCLAFSSWVLFAFSCQVFLKSSTVKWLAVVAMPVLMFSQGYEHLNQYLLSDSLALSSVLVQYSLCFLYPSYSVWCQKQFHSVRLLYLYIAVLVLVSAVELATRDANIVLAVSGVGFLMWTQRKSTFGAKAIRIAMVLVAILAIGESLRAKHRHIDNAKSILAGAVLPNEDIRRYFLDHGMPPELGAIGEAAKPQELGAENTAEILEVRTKVWNEDKAYFHKVDRLYVRYLLSHPGYVLGNVFHYWRLIFGQDFERTGTENNSSLLHPRNPSSFVMGDEPNLSATDAMFVASGLILTVLCFIMAWKSRGEVSGVAPLLLVVMGVSNAVLGFFGDVWEQSEMARHAFIGSVVLRTGLALGLFVLMDDAIVRKCLRDRIHDDVKSGKTEHSKNCNESQ